MKQNSSVNSLMSLLLFALFALSMLLCVLFCANRYADLTEKEDAAYEMRTASMFFSTKVRQGDFDKSISVETFDGCTALVLSEEIENERYVSLIYCHDGYLKEIFAFDGIELSVDDGEKLFELDEVSFAIEGDALKIGYKSKNEQGKLILALRSESEG